MATAKHKYPFAETWAFRVAGFPSGYAGFQPAVSAIRTFRHNRRLEACVPRRIVRETFFGESGCPFLTARFVSAKGEIPIPRGPLAAALQTLRVNRWTCAGELPRSGSEKYEFASGIAGDDPGHRRSMSMIVPHVVRVADKIPSQDIMALPPNAPSGHD